jgi:glucitol/sorbitol PTS system EIIA component
MGMKLMKIIYTNKIINAGKDVDAFGDEMIILFGDDAPDTLKDYCYSIPIVQVAGTIKPGQFFSIDGENFKIIYVGELAEKNLNGLGHLTVNFNASKDFRLPGAIVVEKKTASPIKIGSIIEIIEQ